MHNNNYYTLFLYCEINLHLKNIMYMTIIYVEALLSTNSVSTALKKK